jgi:asparagine synthase (glutamine-hydrolysing)
MQAPFTCFSKVRRLEAGTYLRIHQGVVSSWRFYEIQYAPGSLALFDSHEAEERGAALLKDAVRSQLMGEVPVGVLLSGGLDSSAIAACVAELGANLTTFNIGFPEVNEFEFSRAVAEHYGLKHVEIEVTVSELLSKFDDIINAIDEPMADPACFPLYWLCKTIREHVTVVLSGEGGDELFGGYPQYSPANYQGVPYSRRFEAFLERSYYFLDARDFLAQSESVPPIHLRNRKYFEEESSLNSMLSFDIKTWLADNLMMKADKIAMAHSLEGRFPFLDLPFFEFAASLPESAKLHPDGTSKWLLRKMMLKRLPPSILERRKMGFSVPLADFVAEARDRIMQALGDPALDSLWGIINRQRISGVVTGYYAGHHSDTLRTWTIIVLILWCQRNARR